MKKHAYLIIAHNNFGQLERLMRVLDDVRNDIYIHIDKKVDTFDFEYFTHICFKSHVYFCKHRINVIWGRQTQVEAELELFRMAIKGKYSYLHLISGADLPIKSQDEIHKFFRDKDFEFITISPNISKWDYQRLSRYNFSKQSSIINRFYWLQEIIKVDRFKKYQMEFKKGANWCSITQNFAEYLIRKEDLIKKMTRYSRCADECYKQIMLWNSEFRNSLFINSENQTDDMRYTDWEKREGDSPHTFVITDFQTIIESNKLFARKFNESIDDKIIEEIEKLVRRERD